MTSQKTLSVLVVEDNETFLELAIRMLQPHKCYAARTAEQAMAIYAEREPEVVFLDIGLPDKNGHEVLEWIKQQNSQAFVVMLTGSKAVEDVKHAAKAGVAGYVVKPLSRQKVKESLDKYYKK